MKIKHIDDYKKLVKELDAAVAEYIKKKYEVKPGLSQCYTCKKYLPTSEVQIGHYIPRRYLITRFVERNVRPQCAGCNGFRSGSWLKFRYYLTEEIGEEEVKDLETKALMYGEKHAIKEWLSYEINRYREMNNR